METPVQLDFTNLPLIEAAVRLTFEQPIDLTFALINGLGETLRPEFPFITELEGIEPPPGATVPVSLDILKLPGAVYAGAASGVAVTIQNQMLAARWRRQITSGAPTYPRFPAIEEALFKAYNHLRNQRRNQVPSVSVVNMVYVNLVHPENPRTVVRDYFTGKVYAGVLDSADAIHELMYSWREEDAIDLRMHLQAVTAQLGGQRQSGFRLATAGGVKLAPGDDARGALSRVHSRLQSFFNDLLSARAKTEWGLKEDV